MSDLKLRDAAIVLIDRFGSDAEKQHVNEIAQIILEAFGSNALVAEGGLKKIINVGDQLEALIKT